MTNQILPLTIPIMICPRNYALQDFQFVLKKKITLECIGVTEKISEVTKQHVEIQLTIVRES